MDTGDDRNRSGNASAAAARCWLPPLFALLGVVWALGTPYLTFGWMILGAPLFGVEPSAIQLAQAHRYLLGAVACAFLVPVVGLSLALLYGRRLAAVAFVGALGLSVLAGAWSGLLTRDLLWTIEGEPAPPTSTSVRGPIPCQELSGGDNRCPGG